MTETLKARRSYHPTLDAGGRFTGGVRDGKRRLALIQKYVDFSGKNVLDLGCSGGFFAFSLAGIARSVTAVDGDAELIARNQVLAREHSFHNVEFHCERITPTLLRQLPHYDVILFLSVFHHMLIDSGVYTWASDGQASAEACIREIQQLGETLVFEMGQPDEHPTWAQDIGQIVGNPASWIRENVFGQAYTDVRVLRGVAFQRWPFCWFPWLAAPFRKTRMRRDLLQHVGIYWRDFRNIYIGTR